MDKFIVFLLGFSVALLLIIYRYRVIQFTGKFAWAEAKLGSGGSYTLVIVAAMLVWFGSMVYALGTFDQIFGFMSGFFGV